MRIKKQGRIHGDTVADGWAGAVVRKPLGCVTYRLSDRPTDTASSRVACPRPKEKKQKKQKKKMECRMLIINKSPDAIEKKTSPLYPECVPVSIITTDIICHVKFWKNYSIAV